MCYSAQLMMIRSATLCLTSKIVERFRDLLYQYQFLWKLLQRNLSKDWSIFTTCLATLNQVRGIRRTSSFLIKWPSSGRVVPTCPRGGKTSLRRYLLIILSPRANWHNALRRGTTFSCSGRPVDLRRSSRSFSMVWIASMLKFYGVHCTENNSWVLRS